MGKYSYQKQQKSSSTVSEDNEHSHNQQYINLNIMQETLNNFATLKSALLQWWHWQNSGVATPGPTRAQALVEFVCALVKLLNSQA